MFKGSKIYSIIKGRCPKCHQESMYKEPNPYGTWKTLNMNERCSKCGLKYQIEPSFFFGAMYTSYGVGVALGVAMFIVANVFLGMDIIGAFLAITLTLLVLYPVIARLGRNIWINLFIDYKPPTEEKSKDYA